MTAVREALAGAPAFSRTPLHAAICFTDSEWGLFSKPFHLGETAITYPGALRDAIHQPSVIPPDDVQRIAARLAQQLQAA